MQNLAQRSSVKCFTVTLSGVVFLLLSMPTQPVADSPYAGGSPFTGPGEEVLTSQVADTCSTLGEGGFADPHDTARAISHGISHPLINIPAAEALQANPGTGIPAAAGRRSSNTKVKGINHLAQSHISGIVRPFSMALRLFSLVAYTGLDALRPTPENEIPQGAAPPLNMGPGMDLAVWERYLDELTRTRPLKGTMEVLIDGDEFFKRLERTVGTARRSVHLQTYIFDNDDYALNFGRLLKKLPEKVDVKVLMDGLGSIMASGVDHESTPDDHVAPEDLPGYLTDGSSVKVRMLPNPWLTFDHTKIIIIDRQLAFVGGMNIGREYRHVWHDMMVQVEGPVVSALQEEFSRTWDFAGAAGDLALLTSYDERGSRTIRGPVYPVRVLKTRIGHSQIYRAQLAAIKRAKKYIFIENPYLSDDLILHELIMARHRGVDVRIILPSHCNWKAMARSNVLAANEMLANGIRVYMYPGMSHVKAAVIDGWACIGSANLDKASLRFNREINLATSHPLFVNQLVSRLFLNDFGQSALLQRSSPEKSSDKLYEMIADLM